MSKKPYRVIQWATGKNGRALLRGVIDHPALELVGCKVFTADKHGVDAGVIAGREPIGVKATMDLDEILALDADVVLHIPILLPDRSEMDANLLALLRSGKNVIELTGASSYLPALGKDVAKPADWQDAEESLERFVIADAEVGRHDESLTVLFHKRHMRTHMALGPQGSSMSRHYECQRFDGAPARVVQC